MHSLTPHRRHLLASLICDGQPERADDVGLFDACAAFVAQRPRLVSDGTPALSVEASVAMRPGQLCSRRYIVGVPVAAFGRSPWADLGAWLRCADAPAQVREVLERLRREREVPTAIHLGVERPADGPENRRFYVERRPLAALIGTARSAASLAMVGGQWSTGSATVRWRHYLEGPAAVAPALPPELAAAVAALPNARAGYVWQRCDLDDAAGADDTYWHFRGLPIADAATALAALAERHCGMGQALASALGRVPESALLKAVGMGQDGRGPRLKVYQAPPDRAT